MKAFDPSKGAVWISFAALWLRSGSEVQGQQLVYQATGTRAQIQLEIDRFKHDIIYGPGGDEQHQPPNFGSFTVATFDDLDLGENATYSHQGHVMSGGLIIDGSLYISAASADPANPNRLFGDINPDLPSVFQAFSSPSILSVPNWRGLVWVVNNAPDKRFTQNAFGAVFMNVTSPSMTRFEGSFTVAQVPVPTAEPGSFSFLGVIQTDHALDTTTIRLDGLFDRNPVAVDDIILGTAPPLPEAPSILLLLIGGVFVFGKFFNPHQETDSDH
jgi:hypothetical protein